MNGSACVLECINLFPASPSPLAEQGSGFTLQLAANSLTCILGPCDSGKTAYLRLLAGLDPPAGGSLRILGQDTAMLDRPAWRRLRQQAGYVLPNSALLSSQNVLQNVALPAQYHYQHSRDTLDHSVQRATALLEWLGYTSDLNDLPEHLPVYQQRLVAIARCLMLNPQMLFIDEAFAFMDARSCREIARRYLAIRSELNISLVLASYNLAFAKEHADQFIFTHPGGPKTYTDWESVRREPDEVIQDFVQANYKYYSTLSA